MPTSAGFILSSIFNFGRDVFLRASKCRQLIEQVISDEETKRELDNDGCAVGSDDVDGSDELLDLDKMDGLKHVSSKCAKNCKKKKKEGVDGTRKKVGGKNEGMRKLLGRRSGMPLSKFDGVDVSEFHLQFGDAAEEDFVVEEVEDTPQ